MPKKMTIHVTEEDIQANMQWLRNVGEPESKEFYDSAKELAIMSAKIKLIETALRDNYKKAPTLRVARVLDIIVA